MNWYKTAETDIALWLDDVRDPRSPFIQQMYGARGDEIWVNSVPEALNYINSQNVVYISFDHDLEGEEQNGYDLAKIIEEMAFNGQVNRMQWRVHSDNPTGAANIRRAMEAADRFWDRKENELV